jgi:histidinol dehydrogenase
VSETLFRFRGSLGDIMQSAEARSVLLSRATSVDPAIRSATAEIIESVRRGGDDALRQLAARFDAVHLDAIEVPKSRLSAALDSLAPDLRRVLERAAANIERVHNNALPTETVIESEPGIVIGRRPDPLQSVGVYAPGGRASYPSSVLMGAIPARCAGVREVVLCSPPGPDALPPPTLLAAAAIAGVDRVFAIGGAGAIAAMALGTRTVPRVMKIVGPGNAYVAEAKLQLSGVVAIDTPAGPSELLVIADDSASPTAIAREMLAQAEHDPHTYVAALSTSSRLCDDIAEEITSRLASEPRRETIAAALCQRGALLECESIQEAVGFANEFAVEHLFISCRDAASVCAGVRNTGTVFVGECSSVAFGDYMTGANHVLPTGALARSYSGLSTLDFVRWTTYQRVSRAAARSLANDVALFAAAEDLPAHAAAARAWSGDD